MAENLLLPFRTRIKTLRRYGFSAFRGDLVAGLTVAVVTVPQSIAYAKIAGVDAVYGLYTAIVQGIVAAFFTSSSHLSSGPINTQSLLIASTVGRLPDVTGSVYLSLVIALNLLKGLVQIAFGAAGMGNMVRYVSRSVIVGFTAGAGVLIAAGQIAPFLGIATSTKRNLPALLGIFERMSPYFGDINPRAIAVGLGCLAIVILSRLISRFVPGPLLAASAGAAIVWAMGWDNEQIRQIGPLERALPGFDLPSLSWGRAEQLLGGAIVLALVGMMEAYSIAKTIAAQTGERINPNQEFIAQGAAGVVSSFFQCIPGSGSFSRSALNHQAGAQTFLAGIYNSVFVATILLMFGPLARFIPDAALAAILFVIAYGLVDWRYIVRVLPGSRADAAVCVVTFMATLLIPLELAIVVGILLNIGMYLRRASRLHLAEMIAGPGGWFAERPLATRGGDRKRVIFLHLEGDLFFGVADELHERLSSVAGGEVVILRLRRTHSIDSTVMYVLEDFIRDMQRRRHHVILCGIRPALMGVLRGYGLIDAVGHENVFEVGVGVYASARRALYRAKHLLDSSIDAGDLDVEDEPEVSLGEGI